MIDQKSMDEKKFFLKISASHWAVPVLEQGNRALSLLLGKAEHHIHALESTREGISKGKCYLSFHVLAHWFCWVTWHSGKTKEESRSQKPTTYKPLEQQSSGVHCHSSAPSCIFTFHWCVTPIVTQTVSVVSSLNRHESNQFRGKEEHIEMTTETGLRFSQPQHAPCYNFLLQQQTRRKISFA